MMEAALKLRKDGRLEDSRAALLKLSKDTPKDARVLYQCACAHDLLGLEREAIPFYEKAVAIGLAGKDLEGALIGLGSSYRVVGDARKSEETLRRAAREFPSNRAVQAFLSMSLHDLGRHGEALGLLLRQLAETSADKSISDYNGALMFYAEGFISGGKKAA